MKRRSINGQSAYPTWEGRVWVGRRWSTFWRPWDGAGSALGRRAGALPPRPNCRWCTLCARATAGSRNPDTFFGPRHTTTTEKKTNKSTIKSIHQDSTRRPLFFYIFSSSVVAISGGVVSTVGIDFKTNHRSHQRFLKCFFFVSPK